MRRDEGFVTVAVLGFLAVLVAAGSLLAALGTVAVARHRAASAADLAALAAARHLLDGTACADARRVAGLSRATLLGCRVDGAAVTVEVAVPVGHWGRARARARAGPLPTGTGQDCRSSVC